MDYKSIKWEDTKVGDVIWLAGTYQGQFKAYGPHIVVDPIRRCLLNSKDIKFLHFPEDLLVKE